MEDFKNRLILFYSFFFPTFYLVEPILSLSTELIPMLKVTAT